MGSRSKKILELLKNSKVIDAAEKENIVNLNQTDTDYDFSINQRRRSASTDSSSTSFYEDSDDSVRDPDYHIHPRVQHNKYINSTHEDDQPPIPFSLHTCSPQPDENHESLSMITPINLSNDIVSHKDTPNTNTTSKNTISSTFFEVLPTTSSNSNLSSPVKKGRKRPRNELNWKKNIAKRMCDLGKPYESSKTKKTISGRRMKEPCKETCKYKCRSQINEQERMSLYEDYWKLGCIEKQWYFIANSVEVIIPRYRYIKIASDGNCYTPKRTGTHAFFFYISDKKIRICKLFFANTLGINYRPIDTALKKKNKLTNISNMIDNRGRHGKQPKVDEVIKTNIKEFIQSIPKIESHYTRANTKKNYIDGSKSVADLHRDYVELCKGMNVPYGNYVMFYRIFCRDFNISFFTPKKDLCELCEVYKNSENEDQEAIKDKYEAHLREKELSREEKAKDKADKSITVAVYDLQAVHQCPKGDVSVFYYKSKLNVFNFTVYDLHTNNVSCYVWDESHAHRGVNEIGTCIYKYLEEVNCIRNNSNVVFYSDNCAGQQKNKFMISMYLFAVQHLTNIMSITHKYLIKGHTQNEGDSAHSQIERQISRQLKSGPMYNPDAFIGAIKAARKKSEPFKVKEFCFADFYDWKRVCTQMGVAFKKDEENNPVKIGDLKVIKLLKDEPRNMYFKTSYSEKEFKKAVVIKRRKAVEVVASKAYKIKVGISDRKKADLMELVNKNLIPRYYQPFFEGL